MDLWHDLFPVFHCMLAHFSGGKGIGTALERAVKEENPLLLHRQSHFPSENKEENPFPHLKGSDFSSKNKEE